MADHAGGPDRLYNGAMAALGVLLFISPWLFDFSGADRPAWNAWISGIVAIVISAAAVLGSHDWEEWLDLIAGLWIAVSPWFLGFSAIVGAQRVHLIVGLGIVALAVLELRRLYQASRNEADFREG